MEQSALNELIFQITHNYCLGNWQNIVSYYGEELAEKLDFMDNFDYEEVYERGDVKECMVYCNIATIQKFVISSVFDVQENNEALLTFITVDYWTAKLFDKGTGVNEHIWLH